MVLADGEAGASRGGGEVRAGVGAPVGAWVESAVSDGGCAGYTGAVLAGAVTEA